MTSTPAMPGPLYPPDMLPASFVAGAAGTWAVERVDPVRGETLPRAERLAVVPGHGPAPAGAAWCLRGVTSSTRYTTAAEKIALQLVQPGLGRPEATRAALIPIRKSAAWWALSQDERRAIFEERSRHIQVGLDFLPAVARRLYHGRELGEPFDFLTWFEYAPGDAAAFETLVARLRGTEEWRFVEREVDVRLRRADAEERG
jgi:hypothetical protein